jgi:hypothetical protein
MPDGGRGAFPFKRAMSVAVERSPWFRILDVMEAAVGLAAGAAENGGVARPAPWNPPRNPGPLPAELVERAQRLQVLQATAAEILEAKLRTTAKHLVALESIPGMGAAGRSAFLDVTG